MSTSIVEYMSQDVVQKNIREALGARSQQFIASVASLVNNSESLAQCERKSILSACLTAAALDLPINSNLGFAHVIPYNTTTSVKKVVEGKELMVKQPIKVAQFQMGYKGFIQLAMRSGQFQTLNVSVVKEGELTGEDFLTGELQFQWETERAKREALPAIGYVAFFRLVNGFSKSLFMSMEELTRHGIRYSISFKSNKGLWKDDFDAMAKKTVLKLLLSKYAPMSSDMAKAQEADQSVITDSGTLNIDNQPTTPTEVAEAKEKARLKKHIESAATVEQLDEVVEFIEADSELSALHQEKLAELLVKGAK